MVNHFCKATIPLPLVGNGKVDMFYQTAVRLTFLKRKEKVICMSQGKETIPSKQALKL